jgi:hypothetical protein
LKPIEKQVTHPLVSIKQMIVKPHPKLSSAKKLSDFKPINNQTDSTFKPHHNFNREGGSTPKHQSKLVLPTPEIKPQLPTSRNSG